MFGIGLTAQGLPAPPVVIVRPGRQTYCASDLFQRRFDKYLSRDDGRLSCKWDSKCCIGRSVESFCKFSGLGFGIPAAVDEGCGNIIGNFCSCVLKLTDNVIGYGQCGAITVYLLCYKWLHHLWCCCCNMDQAELFYSLLVEISSRQTHFHITHSGF